LTHVDGQHRPAEDAREAYRVTGSALNDTIRGEMVGAHTILEVGSPNPPERSPAASAARSGNVFVMHVQLRPVSIESSLVLKGEPLVE
jgi:hypothetical protein